MLYSIAIYTMTFTVSIFGMSRYQKNMDKRKSNDEHIRIEGRLEQFIWILLILLPPVLLAAFRGDQVGTDYRSYQGIFNHVKRFNLEQYMQYKKHVSNSVELGYWFICHIVYKLGGSFVWVNFICEFVIIFFMWRGFVWFHKKFDISVPFGMFLFYMFQYGYGLNVVRFSIAAAICFYAMRFLLEKKLFLYLCVCMLAVQFHTMAFIAILFYLVNIFNNKTMKKPAIVIILLGLFFVIIELRDLLRIAERFSFLRRYFVADVYRISDNVVYGWGVWLSIIPMFAPLIMYWRKIRNKSEQLQILFIMALSYVPFRFLGYAGRSAL